MVIFDFTRTQTAKNGKLSGSYWKIFPFSPHVQLKHQSEDVDGLFLSGSLGDKGRKNAQKVGWKKKNLLST